MRALLGDMSGQYKEGVEKKSNEKRPGDKGKLEDQKRCWKTEGFNIWRRLRPDLEAGEKLIGCPSISERSHQSDREVGGFHKESSSTVCDQSQLPKCEATVG